MTTKNPIDSILAALGPDVKVERAYDNGKETTLDALCSDLIARFASVLVGTSCTEPDCEMLADAAQAYINRAFLDGYGAAYIAARRDRFVPLAEFADEAKAALAQWHKDAEPPGDDYDDGDGYEAMDTDPNRRPEI